MKITKTKLKQIIKEELESVLENSFPIVPNPVLNITMDNIKETMLSAYDTEVPPPLQAMINLIEARDYDKIREDLNAMREDLIRYHRNKGTELQRQVIHSFSFIRNALEYYKYMVPKPNSTTQQ